MEEELRKRIEELERKRNNSVKAYDYYLDLLDKYKNL